MVECKEVSVSYFQTRLVAKYEIAHWEEVGQDKRWTPDLDWDLYRFLENRGDLMIVALFVDDEPVGYFVGMCGHPTHYRTKWIMRSDLFFIDPKHRKYGVRLFNAAKEFARLYGVQKLYVTWKVYKDIEPIMKRCKFVTVEKTAVADLG